MRFFHFYLIQFFNLIQFSHLKDIMERNPNQNRTNIQPIPESISEPIPESDRSRTRTDQNQPRPTPDRNQIRENRTEDNRWEKDTSDE